MRASIAGSNILYRLWRLRIITLWKHYGKIFQNYDFRGYYSLNRQALLRLIEISARRQWTTQTKIKHNLKSRETARCRLKACVSNHMTAKDVGNAGFAGEKTSPQLGDCRHRQ